MPISQLWHNSLLLTIGIGVIPVFLFLKRQSLGQLDRGYIAILIGASIICLASFLDYLGNIVTGGPIRDFLDRLVRYDLMRVVLYFPGILMVGWGISRWLPAVQSISVEIDRRKQVEEELRHLLEEVNDLAVKAEEASRAKSEFLATMSHELRTPLNAVIGFTQLLQQGTLAKGEETRDEYLRIIESSAQHLLQIINDILNLSKLEAGKIVLQEERICARAVIEEAWAYCTPMALDRDQEVAIEGEAVTLTVDQRLLKQVLINLLSNAVKYTPDNGRVTIGVKANAQQVVFTVTDTGIGMTEDQIASALRPFEQIRSEDTSIRQVHQGTGLGLPLVDRFVALMGGSFSLSSRPGVGTVARVSLPLATAKADAEDDGTPWAAAANA